MTLSFKKRTLTVIALAALGTGCASGMGINRHNYFDPTTPVALPIKVVIDDSTRSTESSMIMGKDGALQAFLVSGVVGAAMAGSPTAIGAIRGKFQAGKAIEEVFESMSDRTDTRVVIHFHLNQFRHAGVPGRLQTLMDFDTRSDAGNARTRSAYACDIEIKKSFAAPFTGAMERDMLREMVEHVLVHWGKSLVTGLNSGTGEYQGMIELPDPARGRFSGRGVECVYDIFLRPQN